MPQHLLLWKQFDNIDTWPYSTPGSVVGAGGENLYKIFKKHYFVQFYFFQ